MRYLATKQRQPIMGLYPATDPNVQEDYKNWKSSK